MDWLPTFLEAMSDFFFQKTFNSGLEAFLD